MNIKVLNAPSVKPVTVAETKSHLRIEIAADDADVAKKIAAAVSFLDPPNGILGRAMISQTLQLALNDFPPSPFRLPYPPVQSIDSIKYYNLADVETTVSASTYLLKTDSEPELLILKQGQSWPSDLSENDPYPVKIAFKAGYGDKPENVPEMIRLWIMARVGDFYLQRENIVIGQTISRDDFIDHALTNFRYHYVEKPSTGANLRKLWLSGDIPSSGFLRR